jgi:hypothetical protein
MSTNFKCEYDAPLPIMLKHALNQILPQPQDVNAKKIENFDHAIQYYASETNERLPPQVRSEITPR